VSEILATGADDELVDSDEVDAGDGRDPRRRPWWRRLPALVLLGGVVAFGALAVLCRELADQSEQHLLQEQTDQAGAVLAVSISQVQAPLGGVASTAAATAGDPATFAKIAAPLTTEAGGYRSVVLYRATSTEPIAVVGDQPRLTGPAVDRLLRSAGEHPFVVVDLLHPDRTLGYGVRDADPSGYVVYGERQLSPNPNVRRRTDEPFSQVDYALYLGAREDPNALLGSSLQHLPITGRRATATIAFGDNHILLVTTPIGRLGSRLMSDLWWIVLLVGVTGTVAIAVLLHRLQRAQAEAVSLAADNARKHDEQRQIAETLQRGLLPERLDVPPGASLSARYWPANDATLVGGDFYDAFRIDDQRWGIVIGDVCGKGIEAAALTGLVRHTLRTASRTSDEPSAALHAVHAALRDHRPATFCTVCFAIYQTVDGSDGEPVRQTLVVALGGHPMPMVARSGTVRPIGRSGTVLGMIEPTVHDVRMELLPGDTLVLFTDGLTDAPPSQGVTTDEIAELLHDDPSADVDELADSIGDRARTRRPSGSSDDTAILVVRFGEPAASTDGVRTDIAERVEV
jgi:serine phosphatase RsbU (regulator of sigma subunit)